MKTIDSGKKIAVKAFVRIDNAYEMDDVKNFL